MIAATLSQAAIVGTFAQVPDLGAARAQLLRSGLSEAEIRAQLRAAGLSGEALESYMSDGVLDPATIDAETLSALEALGAHLRASRLSHFEPEWRPEMKL